MPSPFPGMNPYLEREAVFHDFHQRYIVTLATAIGAAVRPAYFVKVDEHVYVREMPPSRLRLIGRPDLYLTPAEHPPGGGTAAGVIDAPAEVQVMAAVDEVRVPFLEVYDLEREQVVTVIEVLSRSNKYAGSDREAYLAKRRTVLRSEASLVEIDLLRGGPRMPIPDLPSCDYYALVSRPPQRPRGGLWPVRLRDELPVVPIPLRAGEPEPRIPLQPLLHQVYDAASYDLRVYRGPPEPRLAPEDAAWAEALVAAAGSQAG